MTPMADGSAYATSIDSRLWYLKGNKAVQVSNRNDASKALPEFLDLNPAVDGSAYALSWEETGIWHLRGEFAEKVAEVPSLADADRRPQVATNAYFALYLAERRKRISAEEESNDHEERSDDGYYAEQQYP